MQLFRETALEIFWPICIVLWTVLAAVGIGEHIFKHWYKVNALTRRLDRLERERKKKE